MRSYTVFVDPADADPVEGRIEFIREGIAWPVLAIPALWMIYHRLWLVLAGYLVLAGALGEIGAWYGAGAVQLLLLSGGLNLIVALEANDLRRWTLGRAGLVLVGVAAGVNEDEAARRFFATWKGFADARPAAPRRRVLWPVWPKSGALWGKRRPSAADPADPDVLGLFPEPGHPPGR